MRETPSLNAQLSGDSTALGRLNLRPQSAIYGHPALEEHKYNEPWPQSTDDFHLYYDGTSERWHAHCKNTSHAGKIKASPIGASRVRRRRTQEGGSYELTDCVKAA